MKNIFLLLLFASRFAYGQNHHGTTGVPALAELGSDWMDVSALRNFPSVMNFAGGLQTTENLTGFQHLTFPPYAQGESMPYTWDEGFQSYNKPGGKDQGECSLLVNGKPAISAESRWLPYEVQRKAVIDKIEMQSFTRLPLVKAHPVF